MKKYNLIKVLGITFLVGVILTWVIPTSQFVEGKFQLTGTNPLGLIDLFRTPLNTVANFVHYGLVFLAIGGLYGVLNKTGVYSAIVEKLVEKFKSNKHVFLISTTILFIALSSIIGLNYLFFVLVPLFSAVLLLLGYSKITTLAATVGAMLVGGLGAIYSDGINTSLVYFLNISPHNEIITKIIFLIIISVIYVLFTFTTSKKDLKDDEKKTNIKIPLYNKNIQKDKKSTPLIIVCVFALIILIVGMFNWEFAFKVNIFRDLHETIMSTNANSYPLISNLLGAINALGNWSVYDLTVILLLLSALIAWIYSLSIEDTVDSFLEGLKEMLPVAFFATMANILFSLIYFGQSGADIFATISNLLLTITSSLNVVTMSITSLIGGIFYNDFIQFSSVLASFSSNIYNNTLIYPKIALIMQFMHGVVMIVSPTSILLIAGLSYFKIPYKEWLKYIWKIVLQLFAIAIAILVITTLIPKIF